MSKRHHNFLRDITFVDVVLLLAFPLLIFLLMFLPAPVHKSLILNVHHPSWWQIVTNGFMHIDYNHFLGSLIGYLFFVIPTFLVMLRDNHRKLFYKLMFSTIFTTAIVTSFITIIVPTVPSIQGSSGIVAGLWGTMFMFFIYDMYKKSKNKLRIKFFCSLGILISLMMVAIICYLNYNHSWGIILLAGIILLLVALLIFYLKKQLRIIVDILLLEYRASKLGFYLTILLPIIFIFAPIQLFPSQLYINGANVDIFIHYLGFIYGILLSYLILRWK